VGSNDGQRRKDGAHRQENGERRQPHRFCPPCRFYSFS
jgi:ribosomal protein L32